MTDVGPGSLQFQVQCWAQGDSMPMLAPELILVTHGEVEGPLTSAPFQTRIGPDCVSNSTHLSD